MLHNSQGESYLYGDSFLGIPSIIINRFELVMAYFKGNYIYQMTLGKLPLHNSQEKSGIYTQTIFLE